jgi:hypothetical protein
MREGAKLTCGARWRRCLRVMYVKLQVSPLYLFPGSRLKLNEFSVGQPRNPCKISRNVISFRRLPRVANQLRLARWLVSPLGHCHQKALVRGAENQPSQRGCFARRRSGRCSPWQADSTRALGHRAPPARRTDPRRLVGCHEV